MGILHNKHLTIFFSEYSKYSKYSLFKWMCINKSGTQKIRVRSTVGGVDFYIEFSQINAEVVSSSAPLDSAWTGCKFGEAACGTNSGRQLRGPLPRSG